MIGSRLARGAEVTRGLRREVISRSYNILLRASLGLGISDAQCGFKAIRRDVLTPLLDLVQDDSWFFDTELLYHARRSRLAIHEVPVRWVEDTGLPRSDPRHRARGPAGHPPPAPRAAPPRLGGARGQLAHCGAGCSTQSKDRVTAFFQRA